MNKKINIYIYGEPGEYDEYNPAYVCSKEFVKEILYIIADKEPFSVCKKDIISKLKMEEETFDSIISSLKLINALEVKEDSYKLNFTVFLEKDMPLMDKVFSNIGEIVGSSIIRNKEKIYEKLTELTSYSCFNKERLLYHVICDNIFDGTAFQFFMDRNIFTSSKIQPGNRDYIIYGYEDNEKVEEHSDGLLCSSNNYRSKSFGFNSFGDSDGVRKDMFRFFRRVMNALGTATPFEDLNLAYIKLIEERNNEIAESCGKLICDVIEKETRLSELIVSQKDLANFLEKLGYLHIDKNKGTLSCSVPIFKDTDNKVIDEISEIILNDICNTVKASFDKFESEAADLTAIKHGIDNKEISVELWHQVFGETNEYLVKKGFVDTPEYKKGEGRYLRSFVIKNK